MLTSLKFVKGAVARKDFVAELTHFCISGGRVKGYNGNLALSCPISLDVEAKPKAVQFIKAIESCKDTIAMHMTANGRISIKSGAFKAFVECMDEPFPDIQPEGDIIETKGGLLKCFETLAAFISDDASRPWARGIMLRSNSAFVTNNVVLIEYWLGYKFPVEMNVPKSAIVELLRIGEEPTHLQVTNSSVTFHFNGDRWLRTQLYETNWPDMSAIFNKPSNPATVPDGLWEGVETLAPFTDELGRLYLAPGGLATSTAEGAGATFAVPELAAEGCYNHKYLQTLAPIVDKIDLSAYPSPCAFTGKDEMLRGVVMGMRG